MSKAMTPEEKEIKKLKRQLAAAEEKADIFQSRYQVEAAIRQTHVAACTLSEALIGLVKALSRLDASLEDGDGLVGGDKEEG